MNQAHLCKYYRALWTCIGVFFVEIHAQTHDDNHCKIMISSTKTTNLMKMYIVVAREITLQNVTEAIYIAFCFVKDPYKTKNDSDWRCGDKLSQTYSLFIKVSKENLNSRIMSNLFPNDKLLTEAMEGSVSPLDFFEARKIQERKLSLKVEVLFWYSHFQVGTYACTFLRFENRNGIPELTRFGDKKKPFVGIIEKRTGTKILLSVRSILKSRPFFPGDAVVFTCDWEQEKNDTSEHLSVQVLIGGLREVRNVVTHVSDVTEFANEEITKSSTKYYRAITTFIINDPIPEELILIGRYRFVSIKCFRGENIYSNDERVNFGYLSHKVLYNIRRFHANGSYLGELSERSVEVKKSTLLTSQEEKYLKRNPISMLSQIRCRFNGYPKPKVTWEVPEKFQPFLKVVYRKNKKSRIFLKIENYSDNDILLVHAKCSAKFDDDDVMKLTESRSTQTSIYFHFAIQADFIAESLELEYNFEAQVENFIMLFFLLGWYLLRLKLIEKREDGLHEAYRLTRIAGLQSMRIPTEDEEKIEEYRFDVDRSHSNDSSEVDEDDFEFF